MKRIFLPAMLAALALASPARADDHANMVASVQLAELEALVTSLGHEVVSRGPVEGDPDYEQALVARSLDGQQYYLIGTACDLDEIAGCRGIMMQVRYPRPDGVTEVTLMRTSRRQAALNHWFNEAGDILGFTSYVVLDNGISMANLQENLKVLLTLAPMAREQAMQERDEEGEYD